VQLPSLQRQWEHLLAHYDERAAQLDQLERFVQQYLPAADTGDGTARLPQKGRRAG
jgi:hypothetical protein